MCVISRCPVSRSLREKNDRSCNLSLLMSVGQQHYSSITQFTKVCCAKVRLRCCKVYESVGLGVAAHWYTKSIKLADSRPLRNKANFTPSLAGLDTTTLTARFRINSTPCPATRSCLS